MLKDDTTNLTRDNDEMSQNIIFDKSKETKCSYFIKEYNTSIEFTVKTIKNEITNKDIDIEYIIKDTNEKYKFKLEMSDKI